MGEFWDFVTDLIDEAERKKTGRKIFKWIERQRLKSKEDIIDLDEKMSETFGMDLERSGKIIALYVRHKTGKMDEKETIREIDKVK